MSKKIVYVDMDNTLFDFTYQIMRYRPIYNYSMDLTKVNKTYNISSWFLENKGIEIKHKLFGDYSFWYEMRTFYYSFETLKFLNKHFRVYIVTLPSFQHIESFKGKINSIKYNYPFIDIEKQLIFINQKQLLKGDYLIDDNPFHIENSNIKNILIPSYPYNKHLHKNHFSFVNWTEVLKYFREEWEK